MNNFKHFGMAPATRSYPYFTCNGS